MSVRNRLDQYLSIPLTFALFIAVPWALERGKQKVRTGAG